MFYYLIGGSGILIKAMFVCVIFFLKMYKQVCLMSGILDKCHPPFNLPCISGYHQQVIDIKLNIAM